ncbi:LysR substrate-binding domain-containing protein [Acetobacter sp.]|jgi:DNA-binding transcriptional LysR family regulator|uniref:LysR substrate-binding domain-containing protein n=1 Tax=Acetobacter sp. TaxID=440 RepID=UPI0025BC53BA|nr:LysR substrate-binding domain-containing protein [Acetobacter sp.]MCH4091035.1 LysR substrate-binding domain-containing protein [Acetobacter sp.]MCI1300218.1 LysR substrate-binding domain-containing protein [Acetobacter sp.]MCI1316114.1 LysR substrate-binding domain-containing protein [Acetobacter sp.]
MTLEQLRIFVTVAELLNMRAAAETLHLSQPAVSAAIAALEERHATRLFDRVGRRLELNDAGRVFLPAARNVLSKAADAVQVLDDLSGLLQGELRIAASQTVATYWLPGFLTRFAVQYPAITLNFRVSNTMQAAAAVMEGQADLGFVEGRIDQAFLLHKQPVATDDFRLYAAPGHRLFGQSLTRQDLVDAQWVLREEGSGTRDHLARCLQTLFRLDLTDLDIRLVLPSNEAVLEGVASGGLISAVSDLAAASRVRAGLVEALDCTLEKRNFHMLRHRERPLSRAAQAFVAML